MDEKEKQNKLIYEELEKGSTVYMSHQYTDPDTLEMKIQGFTARKQYKEKRYQRTRLIDLFDALVTSEPSAQNMTMCYIVSNLITAENIVMGSQSYIAKQLHLSTRSVERVFKHLKEQGIVIYPKGVKGYFRVNPSVIMQGSDVLEQKLLKDVARELNEDEILQFSKVRSYKTPALKKAIEDRKAGGKNEE